MEPGALGSTPRQPYWAARKLICNAYLSRLALRAAAPNATTSSPELDLAKANPLTRKAISALVQLSFHRYNAVAMRAGRAIAGLMPICTSLGMCLLPALASRLALMAPTASGSAAVPEDVTVDGGYCIPLTQDAAEALLQAHMRELDGLIGSADSQAGFVERCTSDNKHALLGALGLLDALRGYLPMTVSLHPSALVAVFSSMMLLQSYSLLVCIPKLCQLGQLVLATKPYHMVSRGCLYPEKGFKIVNAHHDISGRAVVDVGPITADILQLHA